MTSDKAPTEITYSSGPSNSGKSNSTALFNLRALDSTLPSTSKHLPSGQSGEPRWGFQLRGEEDRIRCVKLLLDGHQKLPKYVSQNDLKEQLKNAGKTAEVVVTDYLSGLWKHTLETLERRYGKFFISTTKMDVILTVPAVWSDAAKDATLRAARAAGMGDNLAMISEPEAAAVYTLKSIQPNHLRKGDNYVLCDAGGGTVDLVSYQVEQVSPLRLQESAEGRYWWMLRRSNAEHAFESHVRLMLGASTFDRIRQKRPRCWQTALKYFEDNVKRNYDPDDVEGEFFVPFPGLSDGEAPGVEEGYLTITSADLQVVFAPILEEITQLVQGQVDCLLSRGKSVNGIVLVGGFGQSNCLFKHLQARFSKLAGPGHISGDAIAREHGTKPFEVMQPVNAWTAVVRGAVLRGLEGVELVLNRRARRHYGIRSRRNFDPSVHPIGCKAWDSCEEVWKAEDRMKWFITKGQNCSSTSPILMSFYRKFSNDHSKKMHNVELVVCDEEKAPVGFETGRQATTKVICTLTADLDLVPARFFKHHTNSSGLRYQSLSFDLGMQVQSGGLRFDLRVDGVTYGDVVASFN